jgi:large subunit ribosomal protein L22
MKASLHNYHQAPRKVRLVVDAIRGKSVPQAKRLLSFMPKYAAPAIEKLLDSAVANARATGASAEQLFVKTIQVDKGLVGKRGRPFARGRSGVIRKTMSHVSLELGSIAPLAKKPRAKKAAAK